MRPRAFTFIALVLLTGCDMAGGPFAGADEPVAYRPGEAGTVDHALCLLGFAAVPVRNVRPGHQLVTARINGVAGDFVLDTGANVTVVDAARADDYGLSAQGGGLLGSGAARFIGTSGTARQARVESFAVGPVAIRQRRVLVADLGQLLGALGQTSGREVSGVIGQDVLAEHRAIIDVARPMLYLMEADRDPAPVAAEGCAAAAAAGAAPDSGGAGR